MSEEDGPLSISGFYGIKEVNDEQLANVVKNTGEEVSMIYNKLMNTIIPEIRKLGFTSDIVPLPYSSQGCYWSDYPNSYLTKKHGKNYFDNEKDITFIIYLDEEGQNINLSRDVNISFSNMNKETKKTILTLFYQELPNHYEWSGDNNQAMHIYYEGKNIPKLDFDLLRSQDTYPQLSMHINMVEDGLIDRGIKQLLVMQDLDKIINTLKSDFSYGDWDIELTINLVSEKEIEDLYDTIANILDKYKTKDKNIAKIERVKNYSATYYYDGVNVLYKLPLTQKGKLDLQKDVKKGDSDFGKKLRRTKARK